MTLIGFEGLLMKKVMHIFGTRTRLNFPYFNLTQSAQRDLGLNSAWVNVRLIRQKPFIRLAYLFLMAVGRRGLRLSMEFEGLLTNISKSGPDHKMIKKLVEQAHSPAKKQYQHAKFLEISQATMCLLYHRIARLLDALVLYN